MSSSAPPQSRIEPVQRVDARLGNCSFGLASSRQLYLALCLLLTCCPYIRPKPGSIPGFVEVTGSKREDGCYYVFFARMKAVPVHFKKQNTSHKPRPFVAVNKGMVSNNSRCVKSRHLDDVRALRVRIMLLRPRKSRLKQAAITQSRCTAMRCQRAIMDRKQVAFINPDWLASAHFANARKALR